MTPVTYDPNFCFPVKDLESARVKLTPFIPFKHAEAYFAGTREHPEIYDYLPWEPFSSAQEFAHTAERIQADRDEVLFAVFDKTQLRGPGATPLFAGIIGLLNTSKPNLSTEIGFLIILPAFWRHGIATTATRMLLRWTLDAPSNGGLGMRRVQWQANVLNIPSAKVAENIGFRLEGTTRWQRIIQEGKPGSVKPGDKRPGRHSMIFSLCWDDWEDGGRERVLREIDQ